MTPWLQLLAYVAILLALAKPLGAYMARVYEGRPCGLDRVLGPVERLLYRLTGIDPAAPMGWKRYVLDLARRRVEVDGKEVHLTPIEYKLLSTLAKHADRVVTHRQLLQEVWGPEPDPLRPRLLQTEPGVGYRLRGEV